MQDDRQKAACHQIDKKGQEFVQLINTLFLDARNHAQAKKLIEDAVRVAKRGVGGQ
jgi:hypothetical protein